MLGHLPQPIEEVVGADPVAAAALGREQRQQGEADDRDRAGGERRVEPRAAPPNQQPGELGHDQEEAEVMGPERQRRRQRPAPEPALAALVERADEEQERQGRQEDEQGVVARLLRVPDQQRAGGRERRRDQPRSPRAQRLGGGVDDRDRRRADERRERADRELAASEQPLPTAGEQVVEGRVRLSGLDRLQQVDRALLDQAHRHLLVEPESLHAEGREPQQAAEADDQQQRVAGGERGDGREPSDGRRPPPTFRPRPSGRQCSARAPGAPAASAASPAALRHGGPRRRRCRPAGRRSRPRSPPPPPGPGPRPRRSSRPAVPG